MAASPVGTVVLVRFPFSDLTESKMRPAVILADVQRGDFILCQITSNPYADPTAIELAEDNFASGSLQRISYVRPGKVFTASERLIVRTIGRLTQSTHTSIVDALQALLREEIR